MTTALTKGDVYYNINFAMKELKEEIHYTQYERDLSLTNLIIIRQEISSLTRQIEKLK